MLAAATAARKRGRSFWRREHRRRGRRSGDNEPRNLAQKTLRSYSGQGGKGYVLARETVADNEAARSPFTARDIKPAVIDFSLAEPRQLKTRNLQVTKLEWSA